MSKKRRAKPTYQYLQQPYIAKVHALPVEPGALYRTEVMHDDWCDLLNGKGLCNCNPEVRQRKVSTVEELL